jgi:hypothetical protein
MGWQCHLDTTVHLITGSRVILLPSCTAKQWATAHSPQDINCNAINMHVVSFFVCILFEIAVISSHILKIVWMEMHKGNDIMTSIQNSHAQLCTLVPSNWQHAKRTLMTCTHWYNHKKPKLWFAQFVDMALLLMLCTLGFLFELQRGQQILNPWRWLASLWRHRVGISDQNEAVGVWWQYYQSSWSSACVLNKSTLSVTTSFCPKWEIESIWTNWDTHCQFPCLISCDDCG